jgi:hypothetical protein
MNKVCRMGLFDFSVRTNHCLIRGLLARYLLPSSPLPPKSHIVGHFADDMESLKEECDGHKLHLSCSLRVTVGVNTRLRENLISIYTSN